VKATLCAVAAVMTKGQPTVGVAVVGVNIGQISPAGRITSEM
jgi:hypothetical protein